MLVFPQKVELDCSLDSEQTPVPGLRYDGGIYTLYSFRIRESMH
jgi:hypothetical protein